MGQRFIAREPFAFSNGATGYRPGGPFDCLGPYAKVTACPLVVLEWFPYPGREAEPEGAPGCGVTRHVDTGQRRTCYATGYADSFFSVPACTTLRGRHVRGFFTDASGQYRNRNGADTWRHDKDAVIFVVCSPWAKRLLLSPVEREPIREPNIYGERFKRGERSAEAVRCYAGDWAVFAYVRGTMLSGEQRHRPDARLSYGEALASARAFVEKDEATC